MVAFALLLASADDTLPRNDWKNWLQQQFEFKEWTAKGRVATRLTHVVVNQAMEKGKNRFEMVIAKFPSRLEVDHEIQRLGKGQVRFTEPVRIGNYEYGMPMQIPRANFYASDRLIIEVNSSIEPDYPAQQSFYMIPKLVGRAVGKDQGMIEKGAIEGKWNKEILAEPFLHGWKRDWFWRPPAALYPYGHGEILTALSVRKGEESVSVIATQFTTVAAEQEAQQVLSNGSQGARPRPINLAGLKIESEKDVPDEADLYRGSVMFFAYTNPRSKPQTKSIRAKTIMAILKKLG